MGVPIYDDGQLRGRAFGLTSDGRRWVHRSDRPLWHPDDGAASCDGECCWGKGDNDPRWLTYPDQEPGR